MVLVISVTDYDDTHDDTHVGTDHRCVEIPVGSPAVERNLKRVAGTSEGNSKTKHIFSWETC